MGSFAEYSSCVRACDLTALVQTDTQTLCGDDERLLDSCFAAVAEQCGCGVGGGVVLPSPRSVSGELATALAAGFEQVAPSLGTGLSRGFN